MFKTFGPLPHLCPEIEEKTRSESIVEALKHGVKSMSESFSNVSFLLYPIK